MEREKLVSEMIRFHKTLDAFQEDCKMTDAELVQFYNVLIDKDRLVTFDDGEKLLGYVESWRINFEQFGRILCGCRWAIAEEDINTGNICFIANTTIDPEARFSEVYRAMARQIFAKNKECEFFAGQARRKKHSPVKVFKRLEFIKNYIMEE